MTYPCDSCIYQTSGSACHYTDKSYKTDDGKIHNYPGCKKWRKWFGQEWAKMQEMFGVTDSLEAMRFQAEQEDWEGK